MRQVGQNNSGFVSLFGNTVSEGESRYCWGAVEQITYVSSDYLVMIIHRMLMFILGHKRLTK